MRARATGRALISVVLVLLLAPAARAAEHDVTTWSAYFRSTGQASVASQLLANHLTLQPTDLRAQRAYIQLQVWELGEGVFLERQYRDWLAADPDDPVRAAALAAVLEAVHPGTGGWCEEADALLGPLPDGAEDRYQALLIRASVNRKCAIYDEGLVARVEAAAGKAEAGARATLRTRLRSDGLSPRFLAELKRTWRRTPHAIIVASALWDRGEEDESDDPALLQAQGDALAAARRLARGDDPVVARWTWALLGRAGDAGEQEALAAHIVALDPAASPARWSADPVGSQIRAAAAGHDPQVALETLDRLAEALPTAGPVRSQLELARRGTLKRLDRDEDAYLALRAASRADPSAAATANEWAYEAGQRGDDLEEALGAVESALAALDGQAFSGKEVRGADPGAQPFDVWVEREAKKRSAYLDTQAWILHRLGRDEEAAVVMRRALLLDPNPVNHLHMGFIAEALGQPQTAVEHLLIGLSFDRVGESVLVTAAQALLSTIAWDARAQWHPDGYGGVIETRRAVRRGATMPPKAARPTAAPHDLVGQEFPDLVLSVDGEQRRVSELAGPLVIELWATWCRPCLEAMPHLDALARRHAGAVTVVALSVDAEPAQVTAYFTGAPPPAYTVAWSGPGAYAATRIRGIPSAFVLDAEHTVVAYVRGFSGADDQRLEDAVAHLLGQ